MNANKMANKGILYYKAKLTNKKQYTKIITLKKWEREMGKKRKNKRKNFTKEIMSAIIVILAMLFGYISQNVDYLNNIEITNNLNTTNTTNIVRNERKYYRYNRNTRVFIKSVCRNKQQYSIFY